MADLIKKIKIKKQDGTFTDYIPIGAEAKNVDTTDGESVQLKLNKKPYYYNSVADMKADTKLKAGDMAVTLGYYEANDGGAAQYKIRILTNNDVVDNGSILKIANNDLVAELITLNDTINVKQFGAKGNEITDDHQAIINALNYIYKKISSHSTAQSVKSNYILEFNKGIYLNNSLIYYDNYIDNLIIKGNGAYITGYGFKFSTKIGYNVNIDNLNFCNVNTCYEFDYIDRNYQTMLFTNSTYRDCNNIFKINRRSCMVKFENCKFIGMIKAMYLNNVDKVEIANCWFQTSNDSVDEYASVIEQVGIQEGWIDVHDSFFIPQLKGADIIPWFKINKKLTFHENRASGESPNAMSLVYTSSDMDEDDASNQKYIISIYNNPIIDCKHLVVLNGIPNMLNISNNGGYKNVSNKLIIWDSVVNSASQETKLQAKISSFRINLVANSFRHFDLQPGVINLPSSVKPIIPDNLLDFIQRDYTSINNQMQIRTTKHEKNGANLTELNITLYDLSNYDKRNNSGGMWLFAYKGYTSGNASAENMIDIISLKQNGSTSNFIINKETLVGNRTGDYTITFADGATSVDTTQIPNPVIVIKPVAGRVLAYAQFSKIELKDILDLGQL